MQIVDLGDSVHPGIRAFFDTLARFLRGDRTCFNCFHMVPSRALHFFHRRPFCDRECAHSWATSELERQLRAVV